MSQNEAEIRIRLNFPDVDTSARAIERRIDEMGASSARTATRIESASEAVRRSLGRQQQVTEQLRVAFGELEAFETRAQAARTTRAAQAIRDSAAYQETIARTTALTEQLALAENQVAIATARAAEARLTASRLVNREEERGAQAFLARVTGRAGYGALPASGGIGVFAGAGAAIGATFLASQAGDALEAYRTQQKALGLLDAAHLPGGRGEADALASRLGITTARAADIVRDSAKQEVLDAYAKQIGTTTERLTDLDRATARFAEVQREANKVIAEAGGSLDSPIAKYERLSSRLEDVKANAGWLILHIPQVQQALEAGASDQGSYVQKIAQFLPSLITGGISSVAGYLTPEAIGVVSPYAGTSYEAPDQLRARAASYRPPPEDPGLIRLRNEVSAQIADAQGQLEAARLRNPIDILNARYDETGREISARAKDFYDDPQKSTAEKGVYSQGVTERFLINERARTEAIKREYDKLYDDVAERTRALGREFEGAFDPLQAAFGRMNASVESLSQHFKDLPENMRGSVAEAIDLQHRLGALDVARTVRSQILSISDDGARLEQLRAQSRYSSRLSDLFGDGAQGAYGVVDPSATGIDFGGGYGGSFVGGDDYNFGGAYGGRFADENRGAEAVNFGGGYGSTTYYRAAIGPETVQQRAARAFRDQAAIRGGVLALLSKQKDAQGRPLFDAAQQAEIAGRLSLETTKQTLDALDKSAFTSSQRSQYAGLVESYQQTNATQLAAALIGDQKQAADVAATATNTKATADKLGALYDDWVTVAKQVNSGLLNVGTDLSLPELLAKFLSEGQTIVITNRTGFSAELSTQDRSGLPPADNGTNEGVR